MACDTFIKIAQKCKRQFVMQQSNEVMPYIDEILQTINQITTDLTTQQVHTFYEAVGYMISAESRKPNQERLIQSLMSNPNIAWDDIVHRASQDQSVLDDPDIIKMLGNILKTNVSACISVGSPFIIQIGRVYSDMLAIYKLVSQAIAAQIHLQGMTAFHFFFSFVYSLYCATLLTIHLTSSESASGPIATRTPKVRGLRTVKKETLKLIEVYLERAEDLTSVTQNMIPPLLQAVLGDYKDVAVPEAREAEVLNVMAAVVTKLEARMLEHIPMVFEAVFEPTLAMITKNFEDFPEHRAGFYRLIRAINLTCPDGKLYLSS